ncbi:crystal protein-like [Ciona intestinalis]
MKFKSIFGYTLAIVLCGGVIATILSILMTSESSSEPSVTTATEKTTTLPIEPTLPPVEPTTPPPPEVTTTPPAETTTTPPAEVTTTPPAGTTTTPPAETTTTPSAGTTTTPPAETTTTPPAGTTTTPPAGTTTTPPVETTTTPPAGTTTTPPAGTTTTPPVETTTTPPAGTTTTPPAGTSTTPPAGTTTTPPAETTTTPPAGTSTTPPAGTTTTPPAETTTTPPAGTTTVPTTKVTTVPTTEVTTTQTTGGTTGTTASSLEGDFVYVQTNAGKLRGKKTEQGTALFHGVPFSKAPVGDNRWTKPEKPATMPYAEGDYYDATYARAGCPQLCELPSPQYVCPDEIDEDCLHLAVYLPSRLTKVTNTSDGQYFEMIDNIETANLSVMVFFYGGAFIAGANGVILYDARFIAEKGDVVVVVPNYRVGPFGFFYQDTGDTDAVLGNFGIWDQIKALEWVQENIQGFGGNKNSVTLFGQSAGAQSIAVHMVNSYSEPLFHGAILESNPFGITYKNKTEAQDIADKFAQHMGCRDGATTAVDALACMKSKTMDETLAALGNFSIVNQINPNSLTQVFEPWAPMLDEDLLNEHPYYTFLKGNNHDKPMIMGFAKDEGMFFILQIFPEKSQTLITYDLLMELMFGDNYTDVEEHYPPEVSVLKTCGRGDGNSECDNRNPMDDLVTDYLFTCPSRRVMNADASSNDVWWYMFNQTWSFPEFWENYTKCYDLVCHSAELPYLFDVDKLTDLSFTDEEQVLANNMIKYWSNFAKSGNPNQMSRDFLNTTTEYWPTLFETEGHYSSLQISASQLSVLTDYVSNQCDFFDELDLYLKDDFKLDIRPTELRDAIRSKGENINKFKIV